MKARRGTIIWKSFLKPGGCIAELLEPVIANDDRRADEVGLAIEELQSRHQVVRLIDEASAKAPGRYSKIVATPLEQIVRNIDDAVSTAKQWRQQVIYERASDQGDWLQRRTEALRILLKQRVPLIQDELAKQEVACEDLRDLAEIRVLTRALSVLCTRLKITCDSGNAGREEMVQPVRSSCDEPKHLAAALATRLTSLPVVEVADSVPSQLMMLGKSYQVQLQRAIWTCGHHNNWLNVG